MLVFGVKIQKKSHALILNLIMFCEMFLSSLSSLVVVNDPKKMKRIFPLFIVSENINIHAEPDIEYFRVIDRAFDEPITPEEYFLIYGLMGH